MSGARPRGGRADKAARRSGTRRRAPLHLPRALLTLGCSLALCGCYLGHLGRGQLRTLLDRETLTPERVSALTEKQRNGLLAHRRARDFAESLGLASSTSYQHVIDHGGRGPLRVVTAAPPDRLEPITWWFPIVGRVSYRSYFDPELAERFAADLSDCGYDTYTRSAALYSTLGWFDDPVPLALLSWPHFELVYVIIHELVHETIYVPGDVDYDEALATFIGHHATLEFFADDAEQLAAARRSFADDLEFADLLAGLSDELRALYTRTNGAEDARQRRSAVFVTYQTERFSSRGWRTRRYAGFPDLELNNAFLLANQTYIRDLPCFERELDEAGSLRDFIERHTESPGRHDSACASPDAIANGGG